MNQHPRKKQRPPYYANSHLPPNPGQFYYSPVPPLQPSRNDTIKLLHGLSMIYIFGWILAFIGGAIGRGQQNFISNFGISLFFGILAVLLIVDLRGTVSLQGLIQWRKGRARRRILIGFLCFGLFPFLLAIYFVRTFSLYRSTPYTVMPGGIPHHSRRPRVGLVVGSLVTLFVLISASIGSTTNTQQTGNTTSTGTSPSPTTTTIVQSTQGSPTKAVVKTTPTTLPTKVPTIVPTKHPAIVPTPTAHPTQVPTQPKPTPAPTLSLVFTGAYANDYSEGSVSVHTLLGAALTITVMYCSGHKAVSGSLKGTSYADGAGNHTWTWTPETKCRGTATADVTASKNGQFVEQTDDFTVQ